jgi:pimeloyl-ACP methyl ester carboxylesterase
MLGLTRSAVLSFLLFCFSLSGSAQTIVSPPPKEVKNVIDGLASEKDRATLRTVMYATQPVVIFLPGILGSKLQDGQSNIFGDGSPSEKIAYVEGKHVQADLLDEFKLVPFRTPLTNAYSKPVSLMEGITLAEGARFRIFAYDWRQSNVRSAEDFSNFICDHIEEIRSRPVIFIAHSMGGIVLKYWFAAKYHLATCGEQKIDKVIPASSVKHVVFVGTPHLGAPKALSALLENYYLIGDRDGAYLTRLLNSTIAKALNEYGGTFPSAYELLPRLTPDCAATWANYPLMLNVSGADHPVKDIFLIDLWEKYKWPKGPYANAPLVRQQFLTSNLAKFLQNANALTCSLANYDIDKEFKVTRFYGAEIANTDCSLIVKATDYRGEYTLDFRTCPGDGTVPVESANERGDGRPLPGEHLALLSADAFTSFLSGLFAQNVKDLDVAYAKATRSDLGPVELRAKLDLIVPSSSASPASQSEEAAADITARTNEAVLQRRDELKKLSPGTTAIKIYKESHEKNSASKAPLERATGYQIAAELKDTSDLQKAWSLNNSADISFTQKDFAKAKALALRALKAADAVQDAKDRDQMRRLRGLAAWTIAVSSKKLGQLDDVEKYKRSAIQNGNPKARRQL